MSEPPAPCDPATGLAPVLGHVFASPELLVDALLCTRLTGLFHLQIRSPSCLWTWAFRYSLGCWVKEMGSLDLSSRAISELCCYPFTVTAPFQQSKLPQNARFRKRTWGDQARGMWDYIYAYIRQGGGIIVVQKWVTFCLARCSLGLTWLFAFERDR